MILVLISGASASGKTLLAQKLERSFNSEGRSRICQRINMDDYYKTIPPHTNLEEYRRTTNFDTPDMLEMTVLENHLIALSQEKPIIKPLFSFITNSHDGSETINPSQIILIEGLYVRHLNLPSTIQTYTIHVQTDSYSTTLDRRIERDLIKRNLSEEATRLNEKKSVGPGFFKYTAKTTKNTDFYVANNTHDDLDVAILTIQEEVFARLRRSSSIDDENSNIISSQERLAKSHIKEGTLINRHGMKSNSTIFDRFFSGVFGEPRGTFVFSEEENNDIETFHYK